MAEPYDVTTPFDPHARTGKVMYALWGGRPDQDLGGRLRDPALHERLADLGVRRLQVNLDDEPVQAAMRIPTGEPIDAVVSVWADPDRIDAVTAELAGLADRIAGWKVDERRPLAPDEAADGSRLDGLANVALLRRPAELDDATWRHNWLVDHTLVAIETQATFGYVQNLVVEPVTEDTPVAHALVEELFPREAMTDVHAFYGSGGDEAELESRLNRMMASVSRFGADRGLDLVPTSRYLYDLRSDGAR